MFGKNAGNWNNHKVFSQRKLLGRQSFFKMYLYRHCFQNIKQICILTTLGRCSFGHPMDIHLKCLIVAVADGGWCLCLHIDCVHVDNIVDSLAIGEASHLMAASSRSSLGTC